MAARNRDGRPHEYAGRRGAAQTAEPITSAETSGGWRYRGRPLGVVLIVAIQAAHAIALALSLSIPGWSPLEPLQPVDALAPVDPAAPVVAAVGLAIAFGLWRLHYWAWLLTMCWTGVSMAAALLAYREGEPVYAVMLISVIAVLYLNQREVRRAFASPAGHEAAPDG